MTARSRAGRRAAALAALVLCSCGGSGRVVEVPVPDAIPGAFDALAAYLWCEPGHDGALPRSWRDAFGGVAAESGLVPRAAAGWRSYVGHAVARDVLHVDRDAIAEELATWRDERGAARPRRPHDLGDARLLAAQVERIRTVVDRAPGADFVSLGDEVSVTPFGDPVDLDRAGTTPVDELLGILHGPDVERFLADRAAADAELLAALDTFAGAVRGVRPGTPVALLGNGARTPFGGLAPRELVERFDVLEPYDVGLASLGVASIAGPDRRVLRTVFAESPAATAHQVFEHVLRGGDGLVLWSRRDLARDGGVAAELQRALAAARALRLLEPGVGRRPHGVALLQDGRADAAAWLAAARRERLTWPARLAGHETEHGPAFARRAALRVALEDAGLLPGALDTAELDDPATTARFPLVVASGLDLTDPRAVARLRAHLERGGSLVVDGDVPAALASARTSQVPPGVDAHGEERRAGTPRALRLVANVRDLARRAGHAAAPARFEALGARPLLQSWTRTDDGAWLGIALPAARTPDERAALTATAARLVTDDGARATWLRADGAPLTGPGGEAATTRAGWPLVVRVVPATGGAR